ncbi:MAG: hypothetical protein R2681_02050 [Pyrinomonadaceae bacterium]
MNNSFKLTIYTLLLVFAAGSVFAQKPQTEADFYNLGRQQYAQKNYSEAIASFKGCVQLNGRNLQCIFGRGMANFQLKYFDAAIADFTYILNNKQTLGTFRMQVLSGRLQAYCFSNKVDLATKDENEIRNLGGTISKPCSQFLEQNSAIDFKIKGDESYKARKYDEAIGFYQKAIGSESSRKGKTDNSNNEEKAYLYKKIGQSYRLQDNHREALKNMDLSISLNPADTEANLWRGLIYSDENSSVRNLKAAETDFLKAVQLDPKNYNALNWLVYVYKETKQYQKAVETLTKMGQMLKYNTQFDIAEIYINWGKEKEALATFNEIITKSENTKDGKIDIYEAYQKRSEYYLNRGNFDKGIADINTVIDFYLKNPDIEAYYDVVNLALDYSPHYENMAERYSFRRKLYLLSGSPQKALADVNESEKFLLKRFQSRPRRPVKIYQSYQLKTCC